MNQSLVGLNFDVFGTLSALIMFMVHIIIPFNALGIPHTPDPECKCRGLYFLILIVANWGQDFRINFKMVCFCLKFSLEHLRTMQMNNSSINVTALNRDEGPV